MLHARGHSKIGGQPTQRSGVFTGFFFIASGRVRNGQTGIGAWLIRVCRTRLLEPVDRAIAFTEKETSKTGEIHCAGAPWLKRIPAERLFSQRQRLLGYTHHYKGISQAQVKKRVVAVQRESCLKRTQGFRIVTLVESEKAQREFRSGVRC